MNLAARTILQDFFLREISSVLTPEKKISVGVVGGSQRDPELQSLRNIGMEINLTTYGIDNCDIFLDLNTKNQIVNENDLVLCSQVLEHV